jgi:hypothetical protein
MEKLFDILVTLCCWIRVAASLTVIGAGLGVGAYYLVGGVAGAVAGGLLALLGVYLGVRLANHAERKGQLVEVAYGLSPNTSRPDQGGDETGRP